VGCRNDSYGGDAVSIDGWLRKPRGAVDLAAGEAVEAVAVAGGHGRELGAVFVHVDPPLCQPPRSDAGLLARATVVLVAVFHELTSQPMPRHCRCEPHPGVGARSRI
jgi:hypothetical protein